VAAWLRSMTIPMKVLAMVSTKMPTTTIVLHTDRQVGKWDFLVQRVWRQPRT
jgi:hypothetical protein